MCWVMCWFNALATLLNSSLGFTHPMVGILFFFFLKPPPPLTVFLTQGSYTEVLNITWNGKVGMRIRSGHTYDGDNQGNVDMVMEVTILKATQGVNLAIQAGWHLGQQGLGDIQVVQEGGGVVLKAVNKGQGLSEIRLYPTLQPGSVKDNTLIFSDAQITLGISSGKRRSLNEIRMILAMREAAERQRINSFGTWAETYEAMHTVLAWNTVYDPRQKVFTTFSRRWSFGPGILHYHFFVFSFSNLTLLCILRCQLCPCRLGLLLWILDVCAGGP